MNLIPEHLVDLKKSGLNDETIRASGFQSITSREEIKMILGWDIPVNSLLPFSYPGNGFTRYKLFPGYKRPNDKHTMRYFQVKGSGCHAYFPPDFNPNYSIIRVTEGEKKALRGCQENLNVLGLGGIWNFLSKDETGEPRLIEDLEKITWTGKKVELIPDGDFRKNESVCYAVFRLGLMLQKEGASVQVVVLPEIEKLDDFLVKFDVSEFYKLLRLDLDDPMFQRAKLKEDPGANHLTDLGLGKRFVAEHGRDLRYCYPWQSWLVFDGKRWVKDLQGEVDRRAKDIPRKLYNEAGAIENEDRRKAMIKFALSAESRGTA